jgi:hypothetical protein
MGRCSPSRDRYRIGQEHRRKTSRPGDHCGLVDRVEAVTAITISTLSCGGPRPHGNSPVWREYSIHAIRKRQSAVRPDGTVITVYISATVRIDGANCPARRGALSDVAGQTSCITHKTSCGN